MTKSKNLRFTCLVLLVTISTLFGCGGDRNNGNSHAAKGIRSFSAKDYHSAIIELKQAVALGVTEHAPEEIYTTIGRAYEELNRFDDAITAHQKAIEINPDYHTAWVNLGIAQRLAGDFDQAEESYNVALRLQPEYAELHASLGALYIFKNEPARAIASLEKAIELKSQLAVAHANLALAYAMVERFEDAEAALKQATVLGYGNTAIIQARINSLKALQQQ